MSTSNATKISVSIKDAYPLVMAALKERLVPMLVGSPGLGKSALAQMIAKKHNLKLIDIRLSQADPTDLNGFPMIDKDTGKASYVPMDIFPTEDDEIPEGYSGWLCNLDEINACPKSIEVASYKILLDRMVGMHKLHPKVLVMAAGNEKSDKAAVNSTGTAQQSRMIWISIKSDLQGWLEWADQNGIDHRIKSYLQFKPDMLHNFDPNHNDHTFPCPRTWEFLSRMVRHWKDISTKKLPLIAGTVGAGAAREFLSYAQIYDKIPTIDQILTDPINVSFGDEPSMHYALTGLVASSMDSSNLGALSKFLNRLGKDFQVSAWRAACARDKTIARSDEFKEWYNRNSWELVY